MWPVYNTLVRRPPRAPVAGRPSDARDSRCILYHVQMPRITVAAASAILSLACAGGAAGQDPRALLNQAMDDFAAGRLEAAADGFDQVAALVPDAASQLWQRGIALYYVGRYQDCREQFESHRLVNPNDVENAAWHFLCVARGESPEAAQAALLPAGPDGRAPMREIYEMFRGERTPEQVMADGERLAARRGASARFYALLYVGLYHEALGNNAAAREHLTAAASEEYGGGYMQMVARVHDDWLDR